MPEFMFIYRQECPTQSSKQMSPEDMQAVMQKWQTWIKGAMQAGWMTNPGDALKSGGRRVSAQKVVSDGPFVESKEVVGGFSIVHAETFDQAAVYAKGCPCLSSGGVVEIRELAGYKM